MTTGTRKSVQPPTPPVFHIRPVSAWSLPDFREMWAYRDLLLTLVFRDIMVRYKQSVVGVLWAVIQPVTMMVVFTVIFGNFAKMPSDGAPYAVFAFAALVPWQLFQRALTQGTASLVALNAVMTKVYFPRVFAPLASVLAGLIDFAIALAVLVALLMWYGIMPGWKLALLPVFIVITVFTALALSLWLSGLNVAYRDVGHAMPFLSQIWMFATPIVWPLAVVPEQWRWIAMLNPMAGVVEGFRWALLDRPPPDPFLLAISFCVIAALAASGLYYFNRVQSTFADRV